MVAVADAVVVVSDVAGVGEDAVVIVIAVAVVVGAAVVVTLGGSVCA